jgi:hypothetical protein
MKKIKNTNARRIKLVLLVAISWVFLTTPVVAAEYAALRGVDGVNTVFDVSQGSPKVGQPRFLGCKRSLPE